MTPRKDFQALVTAIEGTAADTANPSISMSSYTASNVPRACPAVTAGLWEAAEALPPTPNATLCENMVASSACVPSAATTADAEKIGALFGTVCGMDQEACAGITSNAANGTYGAFVMCNPVQQLTHALNSYYANQKKANTACNFDGQANVVTPTEAAITPSSGSTSGSGSSGSSSSSSGSGSVSGPSASSSPSNSANSTAPASSSGDDTGSSSSQEGSTSGQTSSGSASQNGTASAPEDGGGAGGKSQGGDTTAGKGGSGDGSSASSAAPSSATPASATASSAGDSSAGASDASSSNASPDASSADASTATPASVVSSSSESASQGSNSATVIQGSSDAGRISVVGNTGLLLAAVAVIASTLL